VDVGRNRAEPGNEGEVENRGHGVRILELPAQGVLRQAKSVAVSLCSVIVLRRNTFGVIHANYDDQQGASHYSA
jgi:hypothetical protein